MKELNFIKNRLKQLRFQIEKSHAANRGNNTQRARGIAMITASILRDIERMFGPLLYKDKEAIHPLIEKHCHPWPDCPICGTKMRKKNGKFGEFHGCTKYPDCGGVRDLDKQVSINDPLLAYLTQKEHEENNKPSTAADRFSNLDI